MLDANGIVHPNTRGVLLAAFDSMCDGAEEGGGVDGWGLSEDAFGEILDAHDAGAGRVHGWDSSGGKAPGVSPHPADAPPR